MEMEGEIEIEGDTEGGIEREMGEIQRERWREI